jgi:aminoglycoside phosphotransferase (APT) family kinase protein
LYHVAPLPCHARRAIHASTARRFGQISRGIAVATASITLVALRRRQTRWNGRHSRKREVLMPPGKMHADEVETSVSLVRRLLLAQFPRWADLPIARVPSAGTDNALYRLGDDMVARLPRIYWAADNVDKEEQWLPRLASHLPLPVPLPVARGVPGEGYPWYWSIYRWLDGENALVEPFADPVQAVAEIARFIIALRQIDPAGGPPATRGVPLAERDAPTRAAIAELHGMLDTSAVTAAWEAALQAPAWDGPPTWLHGDLTPVNLLVRQGQLCAIIDWGGVGVGDPACDGMVAWSLLSADMRPVFRAALAADNAMWARGRGWALSFGLIALPYYQHTNPVLAGIARCTINEVLADHRPA